ncbi:hypothetical protein PSTT_16454, partial [Puccinia striiformis]
ERSNPDVHRRRRESGGNLYRPTEGATCDNSTYHTGKSGPRPNKYSLPSVANFPFVANVFFPVLPLLYNTFVQQRLRNDIRYLRLDTGPCPPTSGFHLTTHNSAQALKIQDRPNHNLPLGRSTVATSPEQNPYSAMIQSFTLPTRNELQRPR